MSQCGVLAKYLLAGGGLEGILGSARVSGPEAVEMEGVGGAVR